MRDCLDMFETITRDGIINAVLVTVARVRGSCPREVGAQMLVFPDQTEGTIGGGNFEYSAIDLAREILSDCDDNAIIQDYPLGPALGQCCGGVVTLLFEPLNEALLQHFKQTVAMAFHGNGSISIVDLQAPNQRMLQALDIVPVMLPVDVAAMGEKILRNTGEACQTIILNDNKKYLVQVVRHRRTALYIYGAGHVGRALVNAILPLDFDIHWIDMRAEEFPLNVAELPLAQHVTDDPLEIARRSQSGAFHLILTHNHQIDFDICEILLGRDDYGYLGMIGSDTKRARFVRRFQNRRISQGQIDKLICPIGISEVTSKRPAEIAIGVAAEIINIQTENRQATFISQSNSRSKKNCSVDI